MPGRKWRRTHIEPETGSTCNKFNGHVPVPMQQELARNAADLGAQHLQGFSSMHS